MPSSLVRLMKIFMHTRSLLARWTPSSIRPRTLQPHEHREWVETIIILSGSRAREAGAVRARVERVRGQKWRSEEEEQAEGWWTTSVSGHGTVLEQRPQKGQRIESKKVAKTTRGSCSSCPKRHRESVSRDGDAKASAGSTSTKERRGTKPRSVP